MVRGSGRKDVDQRYYNQMGAFWTPDPSAGSSPADPGSWNKYAYVLGDPINSTDRAGLNVALCTPDDDSQYCQQKKGPSGYWSTGINSVWNGEYYTYTPVAVWVSTPQPPKGGSGGGSGQVTNAAGAGALLTQAISGLTGNCAQLFNQQDLLNDAKDLQFFDARSSGSGNQTVAQIAPGLAPYNSSGTLQSIVGSANAVTLNGPGGSISADVLLGSQFFADPVTGNNANFSVGQGMVLVHEALHYFTQLDDAGFVKQYGIQPDAKSNESNSSAI